MKTVETEVVPRHLLPECCGGEAPCPYHQELLELRQQVITDPLTGLFNVRHFRAALEQEMERTDRTGMPTALMMVDLDHFKRVNDTYGHEVGNKVLQHVARIIHEGTRKLDVQCRYGGEEFAIILPSTERHLAIHVAVRLREFIADSKVIAGKLELPITASIGLAFYETSKGLSASELIAEADSYLYEAKYNGRNQVRYEIEETATSAVTGEEKDLFSTLFTDTKAEAAHAFTEDEFAGEDFAGDDYKEDDFDPDEFVADEFSGEDFMSQDMMAKK